MTESTAISVIIPHLEAPAALDRCLAALGAQRAARGVDSPAFEIIVVDNGSAVPPAAICAAHGARLAQEPTPGPGPARSHGARLARAPLLAFVDCDCVPAPDWIATIAAWFAAHPETGVIGGDVRIARADPRHPTAIEAYESVYGYRMRLYVERDGYTATCNMAVRAAVFARVGDFGGIGIAEDVDWGRRATAAGIRIDYVPGLRIETPARADFAELARKWDRHIGHDFAEVAGLSDRLRWIARAAALAASPLAEIPRLARSDRLTGPRERALALACLTRIRLYRARRMLGLLAGGNGRALAEGWRRN